MVHSSTDDSIIYWQVMSFMDDDLPQIGGIIYESFISFIHKQKEN